MTYLDALKHQVDADLAVCQQELASLEDHRLPELKTRLQELLAAKAVLDRDAPLDHKRGQGQLQRTEPEEEEK